MTPEVLQKFKVKASKFKVTARRNGDKNLRNHELENVAIANALHLRQPDAAQSVSALISLPVPSLNSLSLSVAVLERFYCLYVRLHIALTLNFDPVTLTLSPLTFDLEHVQ